MRQLSNPWLHTEGYNCFGCNPNNPLGVHMHFYEDGDDIVSVWCPTQNHQSWINVLHGGVQAVLFDEICGWVVFEKLQTAGVTAKMEIRYKNAVHTYSPYVVLRARVKEQHLRLAVVEAELYDDTNTLCAQCECFYMTQNAQKAHEMGFLPSQQVGEEVSLEAVIAQTLNPHNNE